MANIPLKTITFPGLPNKYTVPEISTDLTKSGKAADAKKVGDELSEINESLDDVKADLGELQEGGYIADAQQIQSKVNAWLTQHPEATTTVQDGSLTYKKLVTGTLGFVTPEMFGAVGDGVADDTTAVQNAVDSGKNVVFSNKTYRCSGIIISEPITIEGKENTLLKVPDGVEIPDYNSYTENTLVFKVESNNVTIRNIALDANYDYLKERTGYDVNAKFSSYGVRISDCSNVTVENCIIDNVKDAGIQVTKGCSNIFIRGNIIGKNGYNGAFNRGVQCIGKDASAIANYYIEDNTIYNSGEHGIVVYYYNEYTHITGNTIIDAGLLDNNPDGSENFTMGSGIKLSGCGNSIIANNLVKNAHGHGILLTATNYSVKNIQVTGNHVLYDENEALRGSGISIGDNSENNVISNNIVHGVKVSTYSLTAGITVSSSKSLITGNVVYDCDTCINLGGSKNTVANNYFESTCETITKYVIKVSGEQQIICNNNIKSTSKTNGINMVSAANAIIAVNQFDTIRYALVFSVSADNVNIYGNTYANTEREIYWVFGTPTNSKVDFVPVVSNA